MKRKQIYKRKEGADGGVRRDPLEPDAPLDYYFASYSNTSIHFDMLSDRVRTGSYARAIQHAELFQGKTVVDLGCGTGILSMFAARSGARAVFAVEMATIYKQAQQIIKANGLEATITVLHGKIEELSLPLPHVDIIVSEWMGYLLLYESMFDSVIFARDKYLAPGGKLFPNLAKMFIAGYYDGYHLEEDERLQSYLGEDLSKLLDYSNIVPDVRALDPRSILTATAQLAVFDLETCTKEDLDFCSRLTLGVTRQGFLNGLVVWFDTEFTHGSEPVVLSTSPYTQNTHWKQSCFDLDERIAVFVGDRVDCAFWLRRNSENFRCIDVKVELAVTNALGRHVHKQFFLFQ